MSSKTIEIRKVNTLFALQALIATLAEGSQSYRTARVANPKPGGHIYTVFIYNAA
jgi:hypothetical protein